MKCPYRCTDKDFDFNDCITSPGHLPEDGDTGMCWICGGWWLMVNGTCQPYLPSAEEMKRAQPYLAASRERAERDAQAKGRRLL